MTTPLDMSLDDMIKKSHRERTRGRGSAPRGRGASRSFRGGRTIGPVRRGPFAVNSRPSSFSISKPPRRPKSFEWQHDLFEDSIRAAGISGIEIGTKLYVSNLDYGVTKEDIRELFSEIGELKRFAIHYDKDGRPSGSAEVVYTRRSDGFAALKKYNNVVLDGKPMKIEIVGTDLDFPVSARVNVTGVNGRRKRSIFITPGPVHPVPGRSAAPPMFNHGSGQIRRGGLRNGRGRSRGQGRGQSRGQGRGQSRGQGHGRSRGQGQGRSQGQGQIQGQGQGRGRGRGKKTVEKSADELDKELDSYHSEAMQT